jgi:pre-mRNA-processing factor 39
MDEIRKAYDSFLHEFPLCYVYWKKYADHEEKRGFIERAFAIYENGVTHGIPHSVELWTYYLAAIEKYNNDPEVVTSLYKRAISIVGKDYASHPVWDRYIMYAKNSNNHPVVLSLYEQISKIPLERSESYWDGYKSVLTEYPLESIFTDDQLIEAKNSGAVGQYALKEWLVSQKESIWRKTIQQAALRREWELQILTMSFFDIQPLPESKLDIWRNYIIFEQDYGTPERVIKLYERCIISCCNYSEFWYNYSRYLESHHLEIHVANGSPASTYTAPEAREVLLRATTKYLKRRPDMHIYFAFFEEYYKNYEGAVAVFDRLLKIVPGHIESLLRYISFERRRKNFDKCERLFNTAISEAAIVSNLLFLYIQYGTFLGEAYPEDSSHARRVFDEAIDMYPGALDLWRAYILYEVA